MNIITAAKLYAQVHYQKNDPYHQWGHIAAVLKRAEIIAEHCKEVDQQALTLAAIFHDIDYRSYDTHVEASITVAQQFLKQHSYPQEKIEKIKEIMLNHSTPHRVKQGDARLEEGKILFDADKSLWMVTSRERYERYYPLLYFDFTRSLIKKLRPKNPASG